MRKHFLLLLWLTLLPLAGWAQVITITPNANLSKTYGAVDPTLQQSQVTMTASGGTNTANNAFNGNNTTAQNIRAQLFARLSIAQDFTDSDAGSYTYTLTHSGNDQFSFTSGSNTYTYTIVHNGSRTMTINRANNAVTAVSLEDWAFGDTPNTPSVTATNTDGAITYQYSNYSSFSSYGTTPPTAVGDYYVRAVIAASTNYNAVTSTPVQFSITKANLEISAHAYSLDYGVTPTIDNVDASAISFNRTGVTWADVKDNLDWSFVSGGTDCGQTYTYQLTQKTAHPQYNLTFNNTAAQLTFNQVAGSWTTLPADAAPVYNDGADLVLITAGEYDGTVEYRLGTTGEWTADINEIVGQNVTDGPFTVYYRGVGDVNHLDDAGGNITATIAKRPITTDDYTLPSAVEGLVYTQPIPNNVSSNPSTQGWDLHTALVWTGGVSRGTVEYWRNDVDNWATNIRWRDNAGDWTIRTRITPDGNHTINGGTAAYEVSTTPLPVSIAKADLTPAEIPEGIIASPLEYTGSDLELLTAAAPLPQFNGANVAGTFTYYVDGASVGTNWHNVVGQDADEETDAYEITYTFVPTSNNYNAITEPQTIGNANIGKAFVKRTGAPTLAAATLIYNATTQSLLDGDFTSITGGTVKYTVTGEYEKDGQNAEFNDVSASDVKMANSNKYTISYQFFADASGNFKDDETATEIGEKEIEQYTLYIGGQTLTKTIEEVIDFTKLPTVEPLISIADFLKDGAFLGDVTTPEQKAEILNKLIVPTQTIQEIIAGAKVGGNVISLGTQTDNSVNYKVDDATLLSENANLTITAIEAAVQDAPGDATLTYTGEPLKLVATAANGYKAPNGDGGYAIGKVVYSLTEDGTYTEDITSDETPIVETNAGTYKVYYKVVLDESDAATNLEKFYQYTADPVEYIEVTIGQKEIDPDMFILTPTTAQYTGEDLTPEVSTKEGEPIVAGDDFVFTKTNGAGVAVDEEIGMVDVDTYTFTFKATADGNYKDAATETTKTFEITKAPAAIATAPAAIEDLVYNRDEQELVEAGVSNDGKVLYSLTGEAGSYAEDIPVGEDAGDYTVYYMVEGDANHTDLIVENPVEVNIAKAPVDIIPPVAINLTYNGTEQILAEAATFKDEFEKGEFTYSLEEEGTYTANIEELKGKDAGEYTIYTLFTANKNHVDAEVAPVKVTINKATIGYNLSNLEKVWDGELFGEEEIGKLFTLYAGGEGGKLFGDDEYDKPFTLDLPEDYRDAGTYTFKQPTVTFKEGKPVNYNVTFAGEAQIIIDKAPIVAPDPEKGIEGDFTKPTAITGVVYSGDDQAIVNEGVVTRTYQYPEMTDPEVIGTMVYATSKDAETWSEDAPLGKDATGYTVYYKILGDKNHNDFEATLIEDVAIAPATLTADFLPEKYNTELPYKAAPYEAKDFIPALVGIAEDEGYEVYASEMKDVDEYTILFKGINNYEAVDESNPSQFEVTVKITPIDVIATAPKDITKVYDGTASLEGVVKNEDIKFYGNLDAVALPTDLALTTEGITVGTYAIKVDAAAINDVNKNYNILDESIDGEVEITPAAAIKVGFDEIPTWTKKFGETDPKLTGYTVKATEGEIFADDALLIGAATTAVREEGENAGDYAVTLTIDKTAEVFANYAGVEFDGTAATFEITKNDKTYTVSLANMGKVYDGVELAKDSVIVFTAEDLVIAGYDGDLDKFFVDKEGKATLPTAKLAAAAKDAGEYTINLEGAQELSLNYNFSLVPATYTIEKFKVTEATIDPQKVQKGKELDVTAFTITAPTPIIYDEEGNEIDVFYVTAPDLVDLDDIVTGDAGVYPKGLVIAVDASVAKNYTGLDAFTAELEIIAADAIILADNEDCEPEAQDGVDVTFASRKLNAGTWNVVALPFAVSVPEISDAFGYAAVDILDQTNANPKEIHFKVISSYNDSEDKKIPAYTPFIVKTTEDDGYKKTDFDQVVFHNVNIEAGDGQNKSVEDAAGNKFWGTFQAETKIWGEKFRYMSKGAWYDATNYTESKPAKIGAFRGYIEMVEAGARIFIEEPDGTVTAIDAVSFNKQAAEGMYNLNGVKVNNLNRKGVYIKNGVKVIK